MIKRTLEISREPAHLSAKLDQLLIQPYQQDKSAQRSIPAEDIGLVMVDQSQASFTTSALTTLMRHGAAFVVCGHDHLPLGLMLPLPNHTEVVWRINDQIAVTKPTLKRLWQQVVAAKVIAQAHNLPHENPIHHQLVMLSREVRTGDHTNVEAHAARLYWSCWLHPDQTPRWACSLNARSGMTELSEIGHVPFQRDANGADPVNAMLNYGYAILRAAVARALVSSGLFPVLGLHHRHRANQFCLADDLMEPLRPMIDRRVRSLFHRGQRELDQSTKAHLLHVLIESVQTEDTVGPLMVALPRMTASLLACYRKQSSGLVIPQMLSESHPKQPEAESSD